MPMFLYADGRAGDCQAFGTASVVSGADFLCCNVWRPALDDDIQLRASSSVTATIASIGLGSVPAGLVSILLILHTVGLPIKDVSLLLTKRLDVSDARNDFRTEIKEEIELLKSATASRRPSFTWSEHSKEVYFNAITTNANSRIQSRSGSIGNFNLSWRNALLEPGYTPLNKIEDV
ncbi:hypothetical protein OSTOST_19929 [Ostertagia ostertagi]